MGGGYFLHDRVVDHQLSLVQYIIQVSTRFPAFWWDDLGILMGNFGEKNHITK